MKFRVKILLLILLTLICVIGTFLFDPVPQNPSFHKFSDRNQILGIPNGLNVLSNLPFIAVGIMGLLSLKRSAIIQSLAVIYFLLFTGIILIGLGSGWYHLSPDNNSLVYDRIPMTIVFMAFLSAVVAECIDVNAGVRLLFPLIVIGIASVLYWYYTESIGRGDLRLYGLVQFYPMVAIPAILLLFPSPANKRTWRLLPWILIWYAIAKIFEQFDFDIYDATGFVSGHSLKHIAAAVAAWYMVKVVRVKSKIPAKTHVNH
ncbi:MAG TPA: ceramidase domain-containing protein [Parasegetibacter sp.]